MGTLVSILRTRLMLESCASKAVGLLFGLVPFDARPDPSGESGQATARPRVGEKLEQSAPSVEHGKGETVVDQSRRPPFRLNDMAKD